MIKLWKKRLKCRKIQDFALKVSTLILSKSLISFRLLTKHHDVVNVNQILCQNDSAGVQQSAKSSDLKIDIFFTIQVFNSNFSPNISYNSVFSQAHIRGCNTTTMLFDVIKLTPKNKVSETWNHVKIKVFQFSISHCVKHPKIKASFFKLWKPTS